MIYKIQLDEIVNTSASFRERILSFIYIKQNHCTNLIYYSIKLLATKLLYPIYLHRVNNQLSYKLKSIQTKIYTMNFKNGFRINILLVFVFTIVGCTDNDIPQKENNDIPSKEEPTPPKENTEEYLFEILNLDYPGLEEVKSLYETGDSDAALKKLLTYYKNRTEIINPNLSTTLNETEQGYADYAINEYRFYVNDNYLEDKTRKIPYSLQNNDKTINWEFAPKGADNEPVPAQRHMDRPGNIQGDDHDDQSRRRPVRRDGA